MYAAMSTSTDQQFPLHVFFLDKQNYIHDSPCLFYRKDREASARLQIINHSDSINHRFRIAFVKTLKTEINYQLCFNFLF